jgi:hypothetical protein
VSPHDVSIGLAEFASLREECDVRLTAQSRIAIFNFTVAGAITAFVYSAGQDKHFLMVIPLTSILLALLWLDNGYTQTVADVYVRDRLWPYLARTGQTTLPSWQAYWPRQYGWFWTWIVRAIPCMAVFALPAILATVLCGMAQHESVVDRLFIGSGAAFLFIGLGLGVVIGQQMDRMFKGPAAGEDGA